MTGGADRGRRGGEGSGAGRGRQGPRPGSPAGGRLVALPGGSRGGSARGRPDLVALPAGAPGRAPRPGRRRRWWAAAAAALGAVALVLWLAARDLPSLAPLRTVPVREGTLALAFDTQAVVVRDELVQAAPAAGRLERLAPEGAMVRAGTAVVRVGGADIRAEQPGAVSYRLDGLEPALAAPRLPWLAGGGDGPGPEWLGAPAGPSAATAGDEVAAGQPLFRVVDPARLWLVAELPAEPLRGVAPDDRARLSFPNLGLRDVPFAVTYKSAAAGGQTLVAFGAAGAYPEALVQPRRTPVQVVFARYTGLIVPREALWVQDGRPGVRVESPAARLFVPVQVVGQDAGSSLVVAPLPGFSLRPGDLVLVGADAKSLQQ